MIDKTYVLANNSHYFFCFKKDGFASKWCGLATTKDHILDYYAIRVEDEWLSGQNKKNFVLKKGIAAHEYANGCKLSEKFEKNHFVIKLSCKKPSNVLIEFGINLRDKKENWHKRSYKTKFEKAVLKVSDEQNRVLEIDLGNKTILKKSFYKKHFPGKETKLFKFNEAEQRCLVIQFDKEKNKEHEIKIRTPTISGNARGLRKYFFDDLGFIAGLPYFTEVWTRDFCLSSRALWELGYKKEVEETLMMITRLQRNDGLAPSHTNTGNNVPCYNSIDTTPLYIISACMTENKEFEQGVKKALDYYEKNKDKNGFIKTNKEQCHTWMDTVKRVGAALEVQGFWVKALSSAATLQKDVSLEKKAQHLQNNLIKHFWDGEYWKDTLTDLGTRTSNPVFLLYYITLPKEIVEKTFNALEDEEFLSKKGLRCASTRNNDFAPDGYHKGCVWFFLTNFLVLSEIKYGRMDKAKKLMKIQKEHLRELCLNGAPEILPKTKVGGGPAQLWSDALFKQAHKKLF